MPRGVYERRLRTPAERLWAQVDKRGPNDCWLFLGRLNRPGGYGQIARGRRGEGHSLAHRLAFELTHGPIPVGLVLLHACDNPPCCNPNHLRPGTHAENRADARGKGRAVDPPVRFGEANHRAKLTASQVVRARTEIVPGSRSKGFGAMARALGVSSSVLIRAVRGRTWTRIEEGREQLPT